MTDWVVGDGSGKRAFIGDVSGLSKERFGGDIDFHRPLFRDRLLRLRLTSPLEGPFKRKDYFSSLTAVGMGVEGHISILSVER